ncbi:MAG: hypothetical protein NT026_02950 [Candidatus Staskawiczbacteria bacterium]|nr:hypothetical protein [Candidatus Staskawiczbacteria bacterium]
MCESRDGKFVVPKKRGAGTGWWVGQTLSDRPTVLPNMGGRTVVLRLVSLLWVEDPEYKGANTFFASDLEEFDSVQEAMDCLKKMGVTV